MSRAGRHGSPVKDAYGGAGDVVSEAAANDGSGPGATGPLAGEELPFTGLDVGLVTGGGGLLRALGFGVRRVSRDVET